MRVFQFTLASCMGVFTVGTICLFSDQQWLIALTATVATIYLSAHLVTKHLPSGITAMMQANCMRLDGSVSNRRTQIEKKATFRLKIDLFVLLLIVFFPTAFLFWLANAKLIPISFDAMGNIDFFRAGINPSWQDEEVAFDIWKRHANSPLDRETYKRLVFRFWSVMIVVAAAWLVACCYLVRSGYIHLLKHLRSDVRLRFQHYQALDGIRSLAR